MDGRLLKPSDAALGFDDRNARLADPMCNVLGAGQRVEPAAHFEDDRAPLDVVTKQDSSLH
jgi:hypothetical protein